MNQAKTYLLWHTHTDERLSGGEDVKLLGTFSSREKAEQAQAEAAILEGFKDNSDGFDISEYDIDKREWREGFVTETHGSATNRYWIAEVGHWIIIAGKPKSRLNYEIRTVMVLAADEATAKGCFEEEAKAYSRTYKNVYDQNVAWQFDKVHRLQESWFFDNQVLDNGKVLEIDSKLKTRKYG